MPGDLSSSSLRLRSFVTLASEGLTAFPTTNRILPRRLAANATRIEEAYRVLVSMAARREPVPFEAEWLLDNYYVIDDVVRQSHEHLPSSYYRELPIVREGAHAGLPRVYALAEAIVGTGDNVTTEASIREAVREYQQTSALTTGELWAVPIMLRLAVLDLLRKLSDQVLVTVNCRREAREALGAVAAGRRQSLPHEPSDSFAAAIWETIREEGPSSEQLSGWVNQHLSDPHALSHREFCRQASNQLCIGNAVTTLRLLSVIDWKVFFESTSLVEAVLRTDPAGIYAKQDFATRDRCRWAIQRLARGSSRPEADVARTAISVARREVPPVPVAYDLIGEGLPEFARDLGYRAAWSRRPRDWVMRHPGVVYSTLLTGLTLAALVPAALLVLGANWLFAVAALLPAVVIATELGIGLTNFVVRKSIAPRILPRLEYTKGIPPEGTTFVVVPTMIGHPSQAAALIGRLEQHALSSADPALSFALLTDFVDASTPTTPDDADCVEALLAGIRRLNATYCTSEKPQFYLFHRRRLFNPSENCWMGFERKRGKLDEFNRLIRGATDTSFSVTSCVIAEIPHVRFVLTLDTDTVLPRDAARNMIATLAHPLNAPQLSADGRRVIGGYAILQPRVSFLYRAGFRSWFARVFAGSTGVDPYSSAASDTSMDLFGRGSFTGKGLYHVDAFAATAGNALPENVILSHDLIESTYARCALATDIEVFDEFPAKYHAYARREHRWIRGDWQLLPWLGRSVPAVGGARLPNVLPLLERWKLIDNLRRSLVAPAALLLLVLAWTVLPGPAWAWTLFGIAAWLLPTLLLAVDTIWEFRTRAAFRSFQSKLRFEIANTVGQAALQLVLLPDQARLAVDAIARTLYRVGVSRRKMLEWETAASAEARLGTGGKQFLQTMWPAQLIAVIVAVAVAYFAPDNLWVAAPLLLLWLLSPLVAYVVSRPRVISEPALSPFEEGELRRTARITWDFFETHVGAVDNGLPPDNFQEVPLGIAAHRTSPTNIGLYLLSVLSAHDFGYITTAEMADRLTKAFDAIDKLERHRGHIFNWYETTTLATLLPAYVSTVDSGNLLGCLLALKHGIVEGTAPPISSGLADTLAVFRSVWDVSGVERRTGVTTALEAATAALAAGELKSIGERAVELANAVREVAPNTQPVHWAERFRDMTARHRDAVPVSADALAEIASRASNWAAGMAFGFLYNPDRELFSIGYNATTGKLDTNHYDLLASEACIASYLAIARGEVPKKHWFRLGRLVTRLAGETGLISWGGTLFEYLMPRILLPTARGVLLDQAQRAAVAQQIAYGRETGLPWGVSESGFYLFDAGQVYSYQSFGVPRMGLKRGLDRDRVIAPYATLLAVDVDAAASVRNFARLRAAGGEGPFGFYEAIDYTPGRANEDGTPRVVQSYMAHHQGMGFLAIANRLMGGIFRERLAREPAVRASELLLDERVPTGAPDMTPDDSATESERELVAPDYPVRRRLTSPHTPMPRTHLLSNGRYTVMLTNAGSGFSRCGDLDVTRWKPDATGDAEGQTLYIRDRRTGAYWSGGYQPTAMTPDEYEVTFAIDKAELRRIDSGIETHVEITVVPDQNVEVRRITVTNRGLKTRDLDITSYAEIVLAQHAADAAHPAFGKLFLETEWIAEHQAIVCRRRPRAADQAPIYVVHAFAAEAISGAVSWETSREVFLGRRGTPAAPVAMQAQVRHLIGTQGAVLDPVFAIRRAVTLKPGQGATMAFSTGVAANREEAVALAERFHTLSAVSRAFELAWGQANIELQGNHWKPDDVHLFQRIAGYLLYPTGPLRAARETLAANRLGQSGLWAFGISGDLPILILRLHGLVGLPQLRQLLQAHVYWQSKAFKADLVVLLENAGGYQDELHDEVTNQIRAAGLADRIDRPDGVFVRKGWQMTSTDRTLLLASARVVLDDLVGPVATQVDAVALPRPLPSRRTRARLLPASFFPANPVLPPLQFDGGYGGFSADGLEFVIRPERPPPTPWTNVIANPAGGFLVTDSGGGFTWAGNSQSNRLTTWSNDPVADPPGDAIYLHDEEAHIIWCPTPLPVRTGQGVTVRHGQGYTVFERGAEEIESELTVFVPVADPVKISLLKLKNTGSRIRRLEVAYFAEWVLGSYREATAAHIVTELDAETGALLARNPFHPDFPTHVAFADTDLRPRTATGDRSEFLGRNGSPSAPVSFARSALSGFVGPGLDPCAAIRGSITLSPGEERTIVFVLGQSADLETARRLIRTYRTADGANSALNDVVTRWDAICNTVQVETPDKAFDLLMNRWLVYQTLSCRLWGRSAFYQSGGAYGFRDQLQDVCALLHAVPNEAKAQLLRAAKRQFVEGDVQHWWHEPAGNGVRTRFCDDFLWLPYTVAEYVQVTGDVDVMGTNLAFLEAPVLAPDQHEVYGIPRVSEQAGTLFEHCKRALAHGWQLGTHGLPLMGTGDWNDGMNTVGSGGKGESVWAAWFQVAVLEKFAAVADRLDETAVAQTCRAHANQLRAAVESQAWDGAWYRRAYFDDGTPLGSASNDECRIDSIAQSWAVLAGGDPTRAAQAMDSVTEHLLRPADRLSLLFAPPFDAGPLRPGYIKGYLPGVRENGGQYTHAAAWTVKALAMLGRGNEAHRALALMNPVEAKPDQYRGEPYVLAGDVYSCQPHVGRAGWTWYTGSSAWLYRVGLEDILGISRQGTTLTIRPCVPSAWKSFAVRIRFGRAVYRIDCRNPNNLQNGTVRMTLNGVLCERDQIEMIDTDGVHEVLVEIDAESARI